MQPRPEFRPRRIRLPAINGPRYRRQNLLRQVLGIGVLEPFAQCQPVYDRPVDLRKLMPGFLIGSVHKPNKQTLAGFRRWAHRWSPGFSLFALESRLQPVSAGPASDLPACGSQGGFL